MSIESGISFIMVLGILTFMSSYTYFRTHGRPPDIPPRPIENRFTSRKFVATIVSVVYTLVGVLGLNLPEAQIIIVDGIIGLYIGLQGYLDVKKAKSAG